MDWVQRMAAQQSRFLSGSVLTQEVSWHARDFQFRKELEGRYMLKEEVDKKKQREIPGDIRVHTSRFVSLPTKGPRNSENRADILLKANGYDCIREKNRPIGWPDLLCRRRGDKFLMELKTPNDGFSQGQIETLGGLIDEGHDVRLGVVGGNSLTIYRLGNNFRKTEVSTISMPDFRQEYKKSKYMVEKIPLSRDAVENIKTIAAREGLELKQVASLLIERGSEEWAR